jgi:DNA-binding CsgD family transcriptional regulator
MIWFSTAAKSNAMVDLAKFSALVEEIYGAATDAELFASLARRIARVLDAPSAVIQIRQTVQATPSVVLTTDNFTTKNLSAYQDHYYKVDEWILRAARIPPGIPFQGSDLIDYSEFEHSECYTDYGSRLGLYDLVGAMFFTEFGMCAFGVHRSRKERRFDSTTKRAVKLLLPHLRNSLELRARLEREHISGEVALDGLDRLSVGVLVVDSSGKLIFANSKGETVLRSARGLAIRHGKVITSDPQLQEMLKRAITLAVHFTSGRSQEPVSHIVFPGISGMRPLMIKVLPMPGPALPLTGSRPFASIFIGEPNVIPSDLEKLLEQLYDLTPAEARLVEGLLTGDSLQEYATRTGVRPNTVRSHMKHVFDKTDTARQAELISKLLRNPVLRMKSG